MEVRFAAISLKTTLLNEYVIVLFASLSYIPVCLTASTADITTS